MLSYINSFGQNKSAHKPNDGTSSRLEYSQKSYYKNNPILYQPKDLLFSNFQAKDFNQKQNLNSMQTANPYFKARAYSYLKQ